MLRAVFDIDKSGKAVIQSNQLEDIRNHFSVKDPKAKIKQARYGNFVPSRLYAITPLGRFQIGMFYDIAKYIKESGVPHKIIITEKFKEKCFCGFGINKISTLNIDLRDYQEESITQCLNMGCGSNVIATAGGKTLVMATLIETLINNMEDIKKILVIVPGIQLIEQTYQDFLDYNASFTVSKWSGDNPLDNLTDVVIANTNILLSNSTKPNMYKDFDVVIVDEVHKCRKGNKINKVIDTIKTPNKFGFTGTMPENKIDEWNIIGKFGPILIEKTSKDLRKSKYISDALVQVIKLKHLKPLVFKTESSFMDPSAKYNEECDFVYNSKYRNSVIAKLSDRVDKNILILVDRIEHGELIKQTCQLNSPDKQVYFIQGSVDVDDREIIRSIMEEHDNVICVAMSAIFSTGINIKNLHYVMFASGGKAKVRIIQAIGRGLRLHENKDMLTIIDLADRLLYSEKHLKKRLKLYEKEGLKYAIKEIKQRPGEET